MPPEPSDRPFVLLDACCVINLLASGMVEEVLATVAARFAVARLVLEDEVLFIGAVDEDDPQGDQADDRKAIRVLQGRSPPVSVRRTSSLLRTWARRAKVPEERVKEVLRRVQRRASFAPPADDPEAEWWRGMVK